MLPVMPKPGEPPDFTKMQHMFGMFAIIWPIMMAAMIGLQALAMRWMLKKARWSDFRIALTKPL